MRLAFEISLPPLGCSSNSRGHWDKRSAATKEHRDEAMLLAQSAFTKACNAGEKPDWPWKRVNVYTTWHMARKKFNDGRYRPLDSGNAIAALKAAIDGLVDAGVVQSDSHKRLEIMPPKLLRNAKEHGGRSCIVIELERVE